MKRRLQRGSRTAADGLDLARTCPGDPNGSITERVADALSKLIRESDVYLDLHTGGTRLSLFPLAGYMLHANQDVRDKQHQMARNFNLPLVWGTDGTLAGRSLSVARDAGIPAIYVEYQGSAVCDPAGVQLMVDGCLNVMSGLKMIERSLPASQVVHDVQDHRSESGFLQRSLPSPCDGFFESNVTVGDYLEQGATIGWVVDPLGSDPVKIVSGDAGLLICFGTFPAVSRNDSLGYIIDDQLLH